MITLPISKTEYSEKLRVLDSLYEQCFEMAVDSDKRLKLRQSIVGVSQPVLNAKGEPTYKFIGGPAHGQYTTRKNASAFFELEGGGYAYYFFLESENNYHWKFWAR